MDHEANTSSIAHRLYKDLRLVAGQLRLLEEAVDRGQTRDSISSSVNRARIRMDKAADTARQLTKSTDAGLRERFVLVVDDDERFANSIRRHLEAKGFEVFVELDATKATADFELTRPATVFIDIVMPHLSGMEVASRIRALSADTTIVMMSGLLDLSRAFEAARTANVVMEKGCSPDVHLDIVNGKLPETPVVLADGALSDERVRRLNARVVLDRSGGDLRAAAKTLGLDPRTVKSLVG